MVQIKGSIDLRNTDVFQFGGAVFVPQLPEYKGPAEPGIYGEMEIPIEIEMLVKYG